MKIEYVHASKYGNGATVAEAFENDMATRGVEVTVHHIQDVEPKALPPADLYLFSSPGRFGKPIRGMQRFLRDLQLPAGTPYALLTTEMAPKPDRKTGRMPTEEEIRTYQKVRPIMNELAGGQGLGQGGRGQGLRHRDPRAAGRRMEAEGGSLRGPDPSHRGGRQHHAGDVIVPGHSSYPATPDATTWWMSWTCRTFSSSCAAGFRSNTTFLTVPVNT